MGTRRTRAYRRLFTNTVMEDRLSAGTQIIWLCAMDTAKTWKVAEHLPVSLYFSRRQFTLTLQRESWRSGGQGTLGESIAQ
jgi:hypothetical protein